MAEDNIVNIEIDLAAPALSVAGFNIAVTAAQLTAPQNAAWDALYGASVNMAEVTQSDYIATLAALGVSSSEDLYVALQRFFGQSRKVGYALIGRRATPVAQENQISIAGTTDGTFTATVNGNDATFVASSNTAEQIRDGLSAAVALLGEPVALADVGTDDFTLTATEAGVPFTLSVTHSTTPTDITSVVNTASVGLPQDLNTWEAERTDWWLVLEHTRSIEVIYATALAVDSHPRPIAFLAQTNDAAAQTAATTDIASRLGPTGVNTRKTLIVWNDDNDEFVDHALAGKMLPATPGNETWANKELSGVSGITPTSYTQLFNKNYIWLETLTAAGLTMTQRGTTARGEYMDIIRGVDALRAEIQTRLIQGLRDNPKIDYTDSGGEVGASIIQGALDFYSTEDRKLLDPDTTSASTIQKSAQSPTDLANRRWGGLTFTGTARGAIHDWTVRGNIIQ